MNKKFSLQSVSLLSEVMKRSNDVTASLLINKGSDLPNDRRTHFMKPKYSRLSGCCGEIGFVDAVPCMTV